MIEFFTQNPLLLIALFCMCWPGILPVIGAWYLARRYDFHITPRQQGGDGEDV